MLGPSSEQIRCGVLGDPIEHSLSPTLHQAGYRAAGMSWEYGAHRVESGGLEGFLQGLDGAWRGLSLTMPLKREALPLCDEVSEIGRAVGAVNTLIFQHDDDSRARVLGDNTDVPGACRAISARMATLQTVTILGGGATATSVGMACLDLGAREIRLRVRSPERAQETLEVLQRHRSSPTLQVDTLNAPEAWDVEAGSLVVSTIPASAQSQAVVSATSPAQGIFEVIYNPWPTPLAAAASARGQVLIDGLDLLVAQAVLQFGLFTGKQVDPEVMRAAGVAALARG